MLKETFKLTRVSPILGLAFAVCSLPQIAISHAQESPAQVQSPAAFDTGEVRVANKPAMRREGSTYVALDARLKQVFQGNEPRTLDELKAMEKQQSQVIAAIEKVTVNVQQGSAQGSGVIITSDGYVLTAAHVAGKPGREAFVIMSNGKKLAAKTLGMNRDKDAGLIKITDNGKVFPHATVGRSDDLDGGEWCIAAGHPGGWQDNRGSVIRVGRILQVKPERKSDRQPAHTLFTDCTLIGGDSGGPLFNLAGELIGIHSRIGTDTRDNMHVPVDVFANDWKRLKSGEAWGTLPGFKPIIGIEGPKDPDEPPIVSSVVPNGPAHDAGVMPGARVLSFDGIKVDSFAELQLAVQQTLPGDSVVIVLEYEGQTLKLPLTVGLQE
jgi:serine protease Do